ncbi:MAG: UDP-N-acetylglucosamine 2-epimerase (non-hydrolyzing) [Gammaproteobacteria bacterium]|nr:UDP-N-acetylglucosamine 2-epimerase (non-hydrolyzing) [Gammaproteobacteria bacterium]
MKQILLVFGTRPETIKLASLIRTLNKRPNFDVKICVTGQHREMLDHALALFGITPDYDLDLMRIDQDLTSITTGVLNGLNKVLDQISPDIMLVHGDTTTAMAASLAAFYRQIPIAHVEAGLRTWNIKSPWPEEANRRIVSTLATLHFAPTKQAWQNLVQEGIRHDRIIITGNTVIDTLLMMTQEIGLDKSLQIQLLAQFSFLDPDKRLILVTGHRRENFGDKFKSFCNALRMLSERHPEIQIVYPVHLNPQVKRPVHANLENLPNVYLLDPLDYRPFIYLMSRAYLIITDSGGIQEEAPSLGKPVLVVRDATERPEAIEAGTAKLVGTERDFIVAAVEELLNDPSEYSRMARAHNPFGDGKASVRIVDVLMTELQDKVVVFSRTSNALEQAERVTED